MPRKNRQHIPGIPAHALSSSPRCDGSFFFTPASIVTPAKAGVQRFGLFILVPPRRPAPEVFNQGPGSIASAFRRLLASFVIPAVGRYPVLPPFILKSLDSRFRRNDEPKTSSCINIMPRKKPSAHPSHPGPSSVTPTFIVSPAGFQHLNDANYFRRGQ